MRLRSVPSPIAEQAGTLYVSAITAWELGIALRTHRNRPDLGASPDVWFRQALRSTGAKHVPITAAIAAGAAAVPATYGRGDPGDCFLIATARLRNLALVTRDSRILRFAAAHPSDLAAVHC
jgi:PIN domain nuclease of toxin-antitoxin system